LDGLAAAAADLCINDTAPPTFIAWRGQEQAAYCLEAALAALAAVASQALHVTKREASPPLHALVADIRSNMPPVVESRPITPDMETLTAALRARIYDTGS
jgi:histidine ammonia-lyase